MKFGELPVTDAVDAILAHTIHIDGLTLKKGTKLSAENCEQLAISKINSVMAAQLEPGDVHEDEAASTIANTLIGDGVSATKAFTGRCNLVAAAAGLVSIDAAAIDALNAVDESVTVATVPNLAKVNKGQTVATIKIIPFAITGETFQQVEAVVKARISVSPFRPHNVTLVNTTLPSLKSSVMEKTTDLTGRRISAVGGTVQETLTCRHEAQDVAETVTRALDAAPDLVVIVGASVTVDRADVVPSGIVAAGGSIEHFGMPVDPGNLMLLATCKSVPVLVLPGCARSPKLNGIDWILERFAVGLDVHSDDIAALGVGGLLVDSPARPLPRDKAVQHEADVTRKPNVAAIVLAAGQSRRMGGVNKLLKTVMDKPLIRKTVESALESHAAAVVVVTGHQQQDVIQALDGLPVQIVHNPNYEAGLSTSLQQGLTCLPDDVEGALICLGDMPGINAGHLNALIDGFDPEAGQAIGVPVHNGKRGNPVLWAQRFFDLMISVKGDVGARHLIGDHEDLVYEVEFGDTAVLTDLDTPEEWSQYHADQSS